MSIELTEPIRITRKGFDYWIRVPLSDESHAIVYKDDNFGDGPVLVRIHSSCLFSEAIGADDCDCGHQLESFLDELKTSPGLLIYSFEEGRGIGLLKKCEAIGLQQAQGLNTSDAFKELGFSKDERDFDFAAKLLASMNTPKDIRIESNNPLKIEALQREGFNVKQAHLDMNRTPEQEKYLHEKSKCLGHIKN